MARPVLPRTAKIAPMTSDDAEGPQDRDLEQKSRDEQDDAENDHGVSLPSYDVADGRVGPDADISRPPLRGVAVHP